MERHKLKILLDEYTLEEILEQHDVEIIDALEYLISYGALTLDENEPQEDA